MFSHCVFFWLGAGADGDEEALAADLRALAALPPVVSGSVGRPAATDHPVVDRSYTVGLAFHFADVARYQAYATHPLRRAFLDRWTTRFTKVVVYDFESAL